MWKSGWDGSLGENGYMYMYGWVPLLSTWNYHNIVYVKVKLPSHARLFETPWTVAYQAPPTMGFSRQEYWSGLPFSSPGDLPDPGIKPRDQTRVSRVGGRCIIGYTLVQNKKFKKIMCGHCVWGSVLSFIDRSSILHILQVRKLRSREVS